MGIMNFFSRKSKGLVDSSKKIIGTEEIKKGSSVIKEMVQVIRKPIEDGARVETFESARNRLNVSDSDLQKVYSNYRFTFMMVAAVVFFSVITFFLYLSWGEILSAGAVLAIIAVCFSQLFDKSFRMFQIRKGALLSVKDFLSNKQEWWPSDFDVTSLNKKKKVVKNK